MNQFYVSLIFIGIILISLSLILVLLEKKKAFSFINNYEKKKQELVEIIYDAEQMIEELNKFSDYVVTQMDFKNEELAMNLKKAQEEIKALAQRSQDAGRMPQEIKILQDTEAAGNIKPEEKVQPGPEGMVNETIEPAVPEEFLFKRNSDMGYENLIGENSFFYSSGEEKPQDGKSDMAVTGNSKFEEVLRLSRNGMTEVDIARRLNIGKGEIQLILELNKQ